MILSHFRGCGKTAAAICAAALCAVASLAGTADREARVDAEGVLRWTDDGSEVALFGVNYYTPFTVDYAAVKRLGLDHRQAIRDDVAHFRRLGFSYIRVHCFDREFSDADGNLIDNHHMEMLDYLVATCASNGIYSVMTPIAWWGGAYAPGNIRGFSDLHSMQSLTGDRATWPAQAHFLKQFAEHVNRFTGRRYADDPAVLAFESINEPLYPKDMPDSLVTEYIDTLTDALRASGTAKPIYYNSWNGRNAAAGASRVDGVTCSMYPTGLVAGHELEDPQLSRIRNSSLYPDAAIARKSRMVYEFDAADMGASYMYPAMAKLFRFEGIQAAAQFQYDPVSLADVNHNWQTHHLNLVHTPGKAIAMAIAAEVFARVPRGTPYEPADEEMRFPPFRVSVAEDLSEMATPDRYLHSNATRTSPPDPATLERVWGCGSSPVVTYGGTGAYFLDKAAPGVWRLQVYPDVFTVADPFTGTKEKKVAVLPTRHAMTVRLPDLGGDFRVWAFDGEKAGQRSLQTQNTTFEVKPGDYLLTRSADTPTAEAMRRAAASAPRFVAPPPDPVAAPLLRAKIAPQWKTDAPLTVQAEAMLTTDLTARFVSAEGNSIELPLKSMAQSGSPHRFEGTLAGNALPPGVWGVTFHAKGAGGTTEYPATTTPGTHWMRTSGSVTPLLSIPEQAPGITKHGIGTAETSLVKDEKYSAIRLTAEDIGKDSAATGYTLPIVPAARTLRPTGDNDCWGFRVVARGADGAATTRAEIGLRLKNGKGLGFNLTVGTGWSETIVPATELLNLWGLPSRDAFRWEDVERVSVLTGAWLYKGQDSARGVTFDLAALEWVPLAPALRLDMVSPDGRWSLFDRQEWMRVPLWHAPLHRARLSDDTGRQAIRLSADRFEGEHESLSLRARCDGKTFAHLWQTEGADAVLSLRVRAAHPKTTAFEFVLVEQNWIAWGTNIPLIQEWQTVRIPVSKLRLYTHWDAKMAAKAGSHLRLSRLDSLSVCFGKWLYPQSALEPHAFEIAEISIERGK